MPPPKQGFRTDQSVVGKPYLRLKIDFKFIFGERPPELDIKTTSRLRLGTEHGEEQAISPAAIGFCLIERKVGVGDQFIDIRAVSRRDSDPCTSFEVENVVVDAERFG